MNDFLLDAETSVIGALLLWPDESREALDRLTETDFESNYAKQAFKIISTAAKAGKKIDAAIFGSIQTDKDLKQYALTASETFISMANFGGYIQTVKNEARKRRTHEKLESLLYSDSDADTLLSELTQIIETEKITDKPFQGEITDRLIKYSEDIYRPFDASARIDTGYSIMDKFLKGLRKGSLSYIGAMPSTGKTAFALNIALKAINEKKRVQFFSLEMSTEQLLDRIFANLLYLDISRIDRKELTKDEKDHMVQALSKIYELKNLWLIDNEYSVEGISGKIAQFKPELVIVDFIQNVRTVHKSQNRKGEIDYISAEFKRLARQNNCHVMVLSQINRAGEQGAPRMSDLKESGNLEADGDYVILMHRPYVQDKTEKHKQSETAILIDKNKFGMCGKVNFSFDGKYQKFTEVETRYDS